MVANFRNFFGSALRSLWKVEWGACGGGGGDGYVGAGFGGEGGVAGYKDNFLFALIGMTVCRL